MLNLKFLFIASFLAVFAIAAASVPGGITELKGDERKEAIQLLKKSLSKLTASGGPTYTVQKINRVTGQVVSGMLYKYQVVLHNDNKNKKCNVTIWSQPWLENGNELTIKCPGGPAVQQNQQP